jgi:hypothetical protein
MYVMPNSKYTHYDVTSKKSRKRKRKLKKNCDDDGGRKATK